MSLKESGRYISRLILISQSKRIEVSEGTFENPGSYIQTLTGKLSEDSDDDFKVYTIQNRFEKSKSSQLNLKLTGIQDSCWILNLVVITMVIWVVKFQMDICIKLGKIVFCWPRRKVIGHGRSVRMLPVIPYTQRSCFAHPIVST